MLQKLEEHDGDTFQMKETHSTLQEEVDTKTKKLKKVFSTIFLHVNISVAIK